MLAWLHHQRDSEVSSLPAVLRHLAITILAAVAAVLAIVAAVFVWASKANAAAPEQFAVYDVCKGTLGNLSYSYRSADGAFLIRCPRESEPRIVIKGCKGTLSFDASYNVVVRCPDGRAIPIVRGPYPR